MSCRVRATTATPLQGLLSFMARYGYRSGRLALAAALLLPAANGLCQGAPPAQSPSLQPDPIVVTVSAKAIPLSASSASVTILTREFVENSRAESMADLLRQIPFLYLSQTGGRGGLTTISLRGGEANFTLVMIDGVPVNDPTNLLGGAVDFSTLSTDNVEQIEIVRGPISSLYGSEGIGGVINILTRGGGDVPHFSVEGALGNFGSGRAGFQSGGKLGGIDWSLSGSYFDIDEQIENDDFSVGTFSFKSALPLGDGKALQFTTRYQDSRSRGFPENGGGPGFSILRDPKVADVEQLTLRMGYQQQVSPGWLYGFDFDLFSRQQDDTAPAVLDGLPPSPRALPPLSSQTGFHRLRAGFTTQLDLTPELSLNLGARVRNEDGSNDTLIAGIFPSVFNLERQTLAGTGEILYRAGRLTLSFGGRVDGAEGFDAVFSPRAGAVVSLGERTRLKTSGGDGFKLPSFYALGEPNIGNPELQPERSRGFDLGFEHTLQESRLHLSGAVFYNSFRDLVDFSPQLFQLVNRSRATTRGVEFGAALPLNGKGRLGGHLQFLDWELQGTTEPLRDRPRWRAGSYVDWELHPRARLRWDILWVGERFDFQLPVPDMETVGGYSTSSVVFGYQLPHGLEAFGRVDNVFDSSYHEFIGFPHPGIYARAGLRLRVLGR